MPILNIELSEYDALRDRAKQLECENKNLSEAIEERVEKGLLRVIKKTVTITRNPWKAINEHALDSYTEKYEFLNFDSHGIFRRFRDEMYERIYNKKSNTIQQIRLCKTKGTTSSGRCSGRMPRKALTRESRNCCETTATS